MPIQLLSRPGRTLASNDQGAGHYPHAELPHETAPTIVAFLDGLPRQPVPQGYESRASHGN